MGFFAGLLSSLGGLSTATKLTIASNVVGGVASYASAKQQRKQAIADQDNQYVRMRNAAQRAGFNPLTVLRATGGQGFTGLPVISKAAAFGNVAAGIFDAVRQAPIDKYNEEVRELEKKQRQADLELMPMRGKLMKAQINNLYQEQVKTAMPAVGMPTNSAITTKELPMTTQALETLVNGALSRVTRDAAGNYVGDELRPTTNQYVTRSGRVVNLPGDEMDLGAVAIGTGIEAIDGFIQLYDKTTGALSKTTIGKMAKETVTQMQNLGQTPPFSTKILD
jgi:hypothetical protein